MLLEAAYAAKFGEIKYLRKKIVMTSKQRLLSILAGKPVDRPAWSVIIDERSRTKMPDDIQALSTIDFYKHIGCDIMLFGNFGIEPEFQVTEPARCVIADSEQRTRYEGKTTVNEIISPWGTLTGRINLFHPIEYTVKNIDDLRALTEIWRNTTYEER